MKRILLLLLFIAAICADAVEVRVKLKDGSSVSGILVWQNDNQMGIATSKDGRAAMRSVDKKDIVDIADVTAEHEARIAKLKKETAEIEKRTEETKKRMEQERRKTSVLLNENIRKFGLELKLKDGSKISGLFVDESDKAITLRTWEADRYVQKTVNRADIVEFLDHRVDSRLAHRQETKERIEKDIATAEEEVRRRQIDIPKAQELLDNFLHQRPANPESAKQRKELSRQEDELRVQFKGTQIGVEIAKAKVQALRNELELVNRDIDKLEKQRKGLREISK